MKQQPKWKRCITQLKKKIKEFANKAKEENNLHKEKNLQIQLKTYLQNKVSGEENLPL